MTTIGENIKKVRQKLGIVRILGKGNIYLMAFPKYSLRSFQRDLKSAFSVHLIPARPTLPRQLVSKRVLTTGWGIPIARNCFF